MKFRIISDDGQIIKYDRIRFSDRSSGWKLIFPQEFKKCRTVTITVPAFNINSDDVMWELLNLHDALKNSLSHCAGITFGVNFEYLPHARADRRFTPENSVPLDIFMDVISKTFDTVYVYVPHNMEALKQYKNVVDCTVGVMRSLGETPLIRSAGTSVLFPDAGAATRFGWYFDKSLTCSKKRDLNTGRIISTTLDFDKLPEGCTDVAIFDDICDGGGTFIPIAQSLKKLDPNVKVHLCVVHGIFSKGLSVFKELFSSIQCVNFVGPDVTITHIQEFNGENNY